jgi:hypothetical protein
MATGSAQKAYHGTLTANTVDTITLGLPSNEVEVINRTGSAEIYFEWGGPEWVCTTAGTPGTWKAMAVLSS